jgi:phosphonate transport system ATP-binding protein
MIETIALTKRFGSAVALDGVSIRLEKAAFTAILGPSGSGKTTLFRSILGLIRPDEGQITIEGRELWAHRRSSRSARRIIAPVFQKFNLVGRLSALTNVLIGRLPFEGTWRPFVRFSKHDREWSEHCMERVGLADKISRRADTLSGGEQQRVAIARGLAQRARIFYADEPIASLDPALGIQILELLAAIKRDEKVTVVCNLHQVDMATRFADSLIGIRNGKVLFHDPVKGLRTEQIAALYGLERNEAQDD